MQSAGLLNFHSDYPNLREFCLKNIRAKGVFKKWVQVKRIKLFHEDQHRPPKKSFSDFAN